MYTKGSLLAGRLDAQRPEPYRPVVVDDVEYMGECHAHSIRKRITAKMIDEWGEAEWERRTEGNFVGLPTCETCNQRVSVLGGCACGTADAAARMRAAIFGTPVDLDCEVSISGVPEEGPKTDRPFTVFSDDMETVVATVPSSAYLPVLLEPLRTEETARILGVPVGSRPARLAQRATDGLPRAVQTVAELLASGNFNTHRRDTLWPANPEQAQSWRDRIDELGLGAHLPDIGIEEFVKAAAWATAPWLVPAESTSLVSQPQVGRILTELRAALWVIAPERRGGTEDHTVLHPWLARNLLGALAARAEEPLYATQFRAMLEDSNVRRDPERHAYCRLALGRFTEVLDLLEDRFDRIPHQDWVDLLTLVTSAPDNKPVSLEHNALYQALVKEDLAGGAEERAPVRNILTRLVAASWLVSNRLAGPDDERKATVAQSYRELAPLSQRPDVAALYKAARQADALF